MSRTWDDSLKGETWAEKVEEMNEDISTTVIRKDMDVSLTDKEYSNLKLLAYKAGLENVGQFIMCTLVKTRN